MPNKPDSVRSAVENLEPYSPGRSIDEIRAAYGVEHIIKMASNENPLGVSPMVREALERSAAEVFRYAQSGNPRLAERVAKLHGLNANQVVLGNGSDEVIDLLIRCKAEPGVHNVVTFDPCFSLYPIQSQLCGVELRSVPLKSDFTFDWQGLLNACDENTALVFVTTPDNPSGYCPKATELEALAKALPAGALLVIDEAYMDFAAFENGNPTARLAEFSLMPRFKEFNNIAILRTFSKSFGLAGLRLGYGVMPAKLADYLCRARPPFSVNILAEVAGIAAIEDTDFRLATMQTVEDGRNYLTTELTNMGCTVYPSRSNFIMLTLPQASAAAADAMFEALLKRGLIIRQLKSYKLPQMLRISVGNADENKALITAMRAILQGE
ncbi:histidinol-phosphate transaminase [Desulfovibrio sp. OttesenSCG-928-F07]|nr:histidinol-phosphate transaminase [Desulfovibrio sp. OttesenSCG-928-F07]